MDPKTARAALSAELPAGAEAPTEILLVPAGDIPTRAHDGRAPWHNPDAAAVAEATMALRGETGVDLKIDYEHQSELAEVNGQPAPAAGWITRVFARDGAVWGAVEWTERAAAMIKAREYRYLSPTFMYEEASRKIVFLTGAALTNDPAMHMRAIARAASHDPNRSEPSPTEGDPDMDPKQIKALAKALGLAEDAKAEVILAAATAAVTASGLLKQVAKALGLEEGAEGSKIVTAAETAKASASASEPDPAKFVPRAEFDRVAGRVAELETSGAQATATAAVDEAVKAGKVSPAQREWALAYATKDPEGFKAYAAAAPAILSDGRVAPAGDPEGGDTLSTEEKAVCRAMGVSEEDFIKSRKSLAGAGEQEG